MSSVSWLPPLNSHSKYTLFFSFHQSEPEEHYPHSSDLFLINVYAVVEFTSPMNGKLPFSGLNLRDTFFFYRLVTSSSSSSSETQDILDEIFAFMSLPFQLEHMKFRYGDSGTSDENLDNLQDLVTIIHSIIYNTKFESDTRTLAFRMDILKSVEISNDEYQAWTSWYNEKRKVNPNFLTEYMHAISCTRTEEELMDEIEALAFNSMAKAPTFALKNARTDSSSSSKDCLICLEELPPQSHVIRLPCSHEFHQGCIAKWVEENNTCPLCRFSLSSS